MDTDERAKFGEEADSKDAAARILASATKAVASKPRLPRAPKKQQTSKTAKKKKRKTKKKKVRRLSLAHTTPLHLPSPPSLSLPPLSNLRSLPRTHPPPYGCTSKS